MSHYEPPLAGKLAGLTSSAIRDLLKLTADPNIVSLAGGLPDAGLMPGARMAAAAESALRTSAALQYTESPGWGPLRDVLAGRESDRLGRRVDIAEIFVTHGSQQALSLLAEVLLDPGALVVVEDPAYVGALQVFRAAGARIVAVPLDGEGLRVDRPAPAPVASYSTSVIRLSSASKIIAPTLRVGWMVAPQRVCRAVELLKQGADLCGSALTQQIAAELLADSAWLTGHIDTVRAVYATRATALVDAARDHFGGRLRCTEASGGMFVWAEFTDGTDTGELLPRALEAGVAFVPGGAFAVSNPYPSAMRMCFTTAAPEVLTEAMSRLARAAGDRAPVHSAQL